MMQRHEINLSAAWEPPKNGEQAWIRHFGLPTGIVATDRVWLVFDGGRGATLRLNGISLGEADGRHDVTGLLRDRNEIVLMPTNLPATASVMTVSRLPAGSRCPLDPQCGRLRLEIESLCS